MWSRHGRDCWCPPALLPRPSRQRASCPIRVRLAASFNQSHVACFALQARLHAEWSMLQMVWCMFRATSHPAHTRHADSNCCFLQLSIAHRRSPLRRLRAADADLFISVVGCMWHAASRAAHLCRDALLFRSEYTPLACRRFRRAACLARAWTRPPRSCNPAADRDLSRAWSRAD